MKNWHTKKNVLLISGIGVGFFAVMFVLVQKWGCNENVFFFCRDSYIWIIDIIRIFLPIFLVAIITYKMRSEVFSVWVNFAKWWVLLTIFFVMIAPASDSGLISIDKGRVSFGMSILFLLISLILITYKSYRLRGK